MHDKLACKLITSDLDWELKVYLGSKMTYDKNVWGKTRQIVHRSAFGILGKTVYLNYKTTFLMI